MNITVAAVARLPVERIGWAWLRRPLARPAGGCYGQRQRAVRNTEDPLVPEARWLDSHRVVVRRTAMNHFEGGAVLCPIHAGTVWQVAGVESGELRGMHDKRSGRVLGRV